MNCELIPVGISPPPLPFKVRPTMQQYELDTFGKSHDLLSNFWNSCFDDLMSTAEKKDKDKADFKSKFQVSMQSSPVSS